MYAGMNSDIRNRGLGETGGGEVGVVIAEDQPLMRMALARAVNGIPGCRVCGEAESRSILFQMLFEMPVEFLIMDIRLQGVCMLGYLPDILNIRPAIRILAMADADAMDLHRVLGNGAWGFLSKNATAAEFVRAVQIIRSGMEYLPAQTNAGIGQPRSAQTGQLRWSMSGRWGRLTARERDIFRLLGEWMNSAKIAATLHISPKTVDAHRHHIKEKLGCGSMVELMRLAVDWVRDQNNQGER